MSIKRRVAAGVGLAALVPTAGGVAAITGNPTAKRLHANIVFTHVSGKARFCEGTDGKGYQDAVYTATGTATGDDELAGDISFRVHAFINDAGEGLDTGSLRIRDAETGAWKAQGSSATAYGDGIAQGIITGETRVPPRSTGDRFRLSANFRVSFNADGSVTGQIGAATADARLPAVALGGQCTGPREPFEVDLPSPGGAVRAGAGGRARLFSLRG